MADIETIPFPVERLREFAVRVLRHYGVPEDEAIEAGDVLTLADLRGIDSHGIARLSIYSGMLAAGRINARPNVKVVRESPSTVTIDGDNGLGLVVGPKANRIVLDKADRVGTGWGAVCNTNHFGIAGYYVLQALQRDQIGWTMTNTTSIVAPLWGAERRLGTNPIAIAFPGKEEPPVVIDMATTAGMFGRIEIALRLGEPIPDCWAIDGQGRNTTDPQNVIEGGALLPVGADRIRGGHKGYCLAAMVDLLCGPLSGANWGPFTPPFTASQKPPERYVGKGIGHFFGAMKINAFIDSDEFKRQVDDWIRTLRNTRPAPGTDGPLIPGDPERESEAIRRAEGVPLVVPVVEGLREVSRQTGVPFE